MPSPKQVLTAAEDHQIEEKPIFVDQVVLKQRVDQISAAVDQEVAGRLVLEPGDLPHHVTRDQRRVVPIRLLERGRHHVFGDLVHPPHQLLVPGGGWPERGPDLIRLPAEQEGLGAEHEILVEPAVLVVLNAQRPCVLPVAVLVVARPFDYTVHCHECSDDQLHS